MAARLAGWPGSDAALIFENGFASGSWDGWSSVTP